MIPPPTPVPRVAKITFLYPFAPPCHISPSAATFASFPASTGIFKRDCISFLMLNVPQPRFTAPYTVPSESMGPGAPIPTPSTSSRSISRSSIFFKMLFATSGRILAPPFSVTVGISHFSRRSPSVLNNPSLTVVPPTSTPKQYLPILNSSVYSSSSSRLRAREFCTLIYSSCAAL